LTCGFVFDDVRSCRFNRFGKQGQERSDLRWDLTQLLLDLMHVEDPEVPAMGAIVDAQLARAALGARNTWQGERKTLPRRLRSVDAAFAAQLEEALVAATTGERTLMAACIESIVTQLGGRLRTYDRFTAS
jgi:hypothetical protein